MEKYKDLYELDSGITELKYNDFIKKNNSYNLKKNVNNGLLIFYAPWCSHCKVLSTELKKIANDYINKFYIGVINIEDIVNKNDILSNSFNIKQYPTYFEIKNGKIKKINTLFNDISDINFYILLNS